MASALGGPAPENGCYLVYALTAGRGDSARPSERVIDPALAAEAQSDTDPLTDRERQAQQLAAGDLSSPDVESTLHLSDGAVRAYVSDAMSKLGVKTRIEAAHLAPAKGSL